MGILATIGRLALAGVLLATATSQCNSPYPSADEGQNVLYTTFLEEPKHLDPAQSYNSAEAEMICEVMEPPFQYNFLKRPYELEPQTAEAVPRPQRRKVEFRGKTYDAVVYTVRLKKGILYQDHPCFVPANRRLAEADLRGVSSIWDLKSVATRELVAADYANGIRRLSDPRLACPIYPTLVENMLGAGEYQEMITARLAEERARRKAAGGLLYNQESDEKYNPIAIDYSQGADDYPFVRVIDRYTFEVVLPNPYPQILYWMAMTFFTPIPPEAVEFFNQAPLIRRGLVIDRHPVGTGPYYIREYEPTSQIVFERNRNFREEYYPTLPQPDPDDAAAVGNYQRMKAAGMLEDAGKRIPMIDRIVFRLEKETIPRWNKFVQGYYDFESTERKVMEISSEAVSLSSRGDMVLSESMVSRGIRMVSAYPVSINYYPFNMDDPVVGGYTPEKRKLRQAISIAFDTEQRIAIFANGQGMPAQGLIPPGLFGHREGKAGVNPVTFQWDEARHRPVRRSLDEAKKLLAEAGYPNGYGPDGQPLTIRYIVGSSRGTNPAWMNYVQKQFARLNIRVHFEISDFNRFQDRVKNGNFQFLDWGWLADYPDPENFLFLLYGPNSKTRSGGENIANYRNPAFDELFVKMRSMENTPERLKIIDRMVDILREDCPWVFGEHLAEFVLYHRWYHNAHPNAMINNVMKYRRIEPAVRSEYRAEYNRPRWWPLAAVGLALTLLSAPAIRSVVRRLREGA